MTLPVIELFECSDCKNTYRCQDVCNYVSDLRTHQNICYNCLADREEALMLNHDKIILYLDNENEVRNYPGTMHFKVHRCSVSKKNIGPMRKDVWFLGPDGKEWHGFTFYGKQLLRCNKPKKQHKHLMSLCKCDYRTRYKYDE